MIVQDWNELASVGEDIETLENRVHGLYGIRDHFANCLSSFVPLRISAKNRRSLHIARSHCATVFGSNRTQVPMRNDGIRPAFACLKIVILETVNMLASSAAVNARPIRSIRSANDKGCVVLSLELHDSIYLLKWIYFRGDCRMLLANLLCSRSRLSPERARVHDTSIVWLYCRLALISRLPESESISVWGASRGLLTTNGDGWDPSIY